MTAPRLFHVYLGRVHSRMNKDDVVNLLNRLNIKHFDLKQIETKHSNSKSFTFAIDYFDREIIKNKEIWPRGLIVNRFIFKRASTNAQDNAQGAILISTQ